MIITWRMPLPVKKWELEVRVHDTQAEMYEDVLAHGRPAREITKETPAHFVFKPGRVKSGAQVVCKVFFNKEKIQPALIVDELAHAMIFVYRKSGRKFSVWNTDNRTGDEEWFCGMLGWLCEAFMNDWRRHVEVK